MELKILGVEVIHWVCPTGVEEVPLEPPRSLQLCTPTPNGFKVRPLKSLWG